MMFETYRSVISHACAHRHQARMLGALGDWQAAVKVYSEVAEAAQKLPVHEQLSALCSHGCLLG